MGLKTDGMKVLKIQMQRVATALPNAVDAELRTVAYEVHEKAKAMAPIDYGDLKDAIKVRRLGVQGAGGRFIKGRSLYETYLDMNQAVRDPEKLDDGYTRVGEYAWEVHQHMGWGGHWRPLMPSKKSVEAGRQAGVEAGGRFMERAILEVATGSGGILTRLIKANKTCLQKLDKRKLA